MSEFQSWCRNTFAMLAPGGVWAVPRSGLIFHRHESERKLTLTQVMPWQEGMWTDEGMDDEELLLVQRNDYEAIKFQFESAGIAVDTKVDFDA